MRVGFCDILSLFRHGYNIDTRIYQSVSSLQVLFCRGEDTGLFFFGDAFYCAAKVFTTAISYFDKHDVITILHNEVDFTVLAIIIFLE